MAVGFRLTRHAAEEMARRSIPRETLEAVLENPQQIVPARRGKKAYQSQVRFADGRTFLVRAIVDDRTEPPTVVTVYRTTKLSKYWEGEP